MLEVNRSGVYYEARKKISEENQEMMGYIDKIYTKYPFKGSRRISMVLEDIYKVKTDRKRVVRLMRHMGIEALYPQAKTTRKSKDHRIYPYLLRGVKIERPDQVWAADITYIAMRKGFVYLTAVMDWYSRKVLSWNISNTMDAHFCVEALEEALGEYGKPEIFNTDQGSQFTSELFTGVLEGKGIRISMDGKRSWVDNVFIERLWRSLKYEEVYLKAYDTVKEVRAGIGGWIDFYNRLRHHSRLDHLTPDQVYYRKFSLTRVA